MNNKRRPRCQASGPSHNKVYEGLFCIFFINSDTDTGLYILAHQRLDSRRSRDGVEGDQTAQFSRPPQGRDLHSPGLRAAGHGCSRGVGV